MTAELGYAAVAPGQEDRHGISERVGRNVMFDNISFGIAASEVMVLLGADGAAKWTRELRRQPIHRRLE